MFSEIEMRILSRYFADLHLLPSLEYNAQFITFYCRTHFFFFLFHCCSKRYYFCLSFLLTYFLHINLDFVSYYYEVWIKLQFMAPINSRYKKLLAIFSDHLLTMVPLKKVSTTSMFRFIRGEFSNVKGDMGIIL